MTIAKLFLEPLDSIRLSNTDIGLIVFGMVGYASTRSRIKEWFAATRAAWVRLAQTAGRSDQERYLADAVDRFEVERREHAWNRGQRDDGSLLGW